MINTIPKDYLHFMAPYIKTLQSQGNRVVLISSGSPKPIEQLINIDCDYYDSFMTRKPSFFSDVRALIRILGIIRVIQPDVVHTISPKAGLLGAIAGAMARVPIRIHTFTGQVWANKKGVYRALLIFFDRIIGCLCSHALTDSHSQRDYLIKLRVVTEAKLDVLGNGSVCGVDPGRFLRNEAVRNSLREELGIGQSDLVFLYMGRLNKDKGIHDLIDAFTMLDGYQFQKCWLLMVGHCEDEMIKARLKESEGGIIYRKYSFNPEIYYWSSDVLCLPSYREGFGNVIIEAASASVPSMASDIYGINDAVEQNKTGLLHQAGNIAAIKECFIYWIKNPKDIVRMGLLARERATEKFNTNYLIEEFIKFYKKVGASI